MTKKAPQPHIVVDKLFETKFCPACGNAESDFDFSAGIFFDGTTVYLRCRECGTVIMGKDSPTVEDFKVWNASTEKERFVFELREEINNLKWHAHTVDNAVFIEQISLILNRIADYIENN